MKILVITNHLADFAGSETVAIEVASTFKELGCDVKLVAAYINEPMRGYLTERNYDFCSFLDCPDISGFDIVWSQHQVLINMLSKQNIDVLNNVFLVTASLSPYEPFEMLGAISEKSDIIVANSQETMDNLIKFGLDKKKIEIFYNAAPDEYDVKHKQTNVLEKLLIISNHVPQELNEAADILRKQGFIVDHIGRPENEKKITAEIISSYDAIISIGKSVQYGILSEVPVFVYDSFGGPGWLTEDNLDLAEQFNFSGRCCNRHITSTELAHEITTGFKQAVDDIVKIKQSRGERYSLRLFLQKIMSMSSQKVKNTKVDKKVSNLIKREGVIFGRLIDFYNGIKERDYIIQRLENAKTELESKKTEQEHTINYLMDVNQETVIKIVNDANAMILRMQKLTQSRSWLFKRYFSYLKYIPRDLSRRIRGKSAPKKKMPIKGVSTLDTNNYLMINQKVVNDERFEGDNH